MQEFSGKVQKSRLCNSISLFWLHLFCILLLLQNAVSAQNASTDFDKFFVFLNPCNMSATELKNVGENFHVKSLAPWTDVEKQQVKKLLTDLIRTNHQDIDKASRGEKIRIVRTHDPLVADKNQNSPSYDPPTMRSIFHDMLLTDGYLTTRARIQTLNYVNVLHTNWGTWLMLKTHYL